MNYVWWDFYTAGEHVWYDDNDQPNEAVIECEAEDDWYLISLTGTGISVLAHESQLSRNPRPAVGFPAKT